MEHPVCAPLVDDGVDPDQIVAIRSVIGVTPIEKAVARDRAEPTELGDGAGAERQVISASPAGSAA